MPARETGKQRAIRIPLDYYKQRSPLDRWKLWLAGGALVLSLGWWASAYAFPGKGNMKYSHGPVIWAHAAWEAKCEACHLPFSPINGNDWAATYMNGGHARASEFLCKACHGAPEHHGNENPASVNNCGSCHHDHAGRDVNLNRVADVDCVRCHMNLEATAIRKPNFVDSIHAFTSDHPEFKPVKDFKPQQRTLKFSHQQHMMPGQVLAAGGERPWTFEMIADPAERQRYMKLQSTENIKDTIQLNCIACHQLDSGNFQPPLEQLGTLPKGAVLTPRAEGAYFRPIVFENQCKACHPLNQFDDQLPSLAAPHRVQPKEMRSFLEGAYIEQYLAEKLAKSKPQDKLLRLDPLEDIDKRKTAQKEIEQRVNKAENNLYQGTKTCGKCHDYVMEGNASFPKEIVPPKPHVVWFEHAKFNHVSHRAVDCRGCHAGADPGPVDLKASVVDKEPLLLPGIDSCKQCHSPERTEKGVALGGIRHDCTECHTYHNGDNPLQGLGAASRDPKATFPDPHRPDDELKMSIERLLSGEPPTNK